MNLAELLELVRDYVASRPSRDQALVAGAISAAALGQVEDASIRRTALEALLDAQGLVEREREARDGE